MKGEKRCPVCQRDLSDLRTGYYAVEHILQEVCIDCIKEKQKGWCKLFLVALALGLFLGYILFFVF